VDVGVVILLVLVVLVVVLAAGGAIAQRRRLERNRGAFEAQLEQVNRDLAAARAEDRGWERETLESAARDAYARERGAAGELTLVRIVDRPGTDEDKAIFRCRGDGGEEELTLGRQDGDWVLESLA